MKTFDTYSHYYNLLYKEKDYQKEVDFVNLLIHKYTRDSKSILDLGCGTGNHVLLLSQKGYNITGVDKSVTMLDIARDSASIQNRNTHTDFISGDIRDISLGIKYDVVTSLFHVMSYQTGNKDLTAVFKTVQNHLKPDGIFIFDTWYGPAVLTERPSVRIKRIQNDKHHIVRIAEPKMRPNENMVDVKYTILIKDIDAAIIDEINETHQMRYLFSPEVEMMADEAGFEIQECREWMTRKPPGFNTWSVYYILKFE